MYMYIYLYIYTLILEMCAYTQRKQICAYKFSIDKPRDIDRCTSWLELQAHVYMHTYTYTHICSCNSWMSTLSPSLNELESWAALRRSTRPSMSWRRRSSSLTRRLFCQSFATLASWRQEMSYGSTWRERTRRRVSRWGLHLPRGCERLEKL